MKQELSELLNIFTRTRDGITVFMDMLTPKIEHAEDEHKRLYFHHIYEEEEHRLDRLKDLIPAIEQFLQSGQSTSIGNRHFVLLLQDISLEKFGLHNFLEHLDLALFEFKDGAKHEQISGMRDETHADYTRVKEILSALNEHFPAADLTGSLQSEKHQVASAAHGDEHTAASADTAGTNQTSDAATGSSESDAVTSSAAHSGNTADTNAAAKRRKGLTVGSLKS